MKALCMLTDVFRHKNPDSRKYTFRKGQAQNYTKARLDYFLMNDDALESVTKVGVGRETALSDHCPVYLHLSFSKVVRGRGFWRLNNDFLKEPEYVLGLNDVIQGVIKQYSKEGHRNDSPSQEPALHPFLISYTLLHDVLLLESRSHTLKYAANQKRKMLKRTEELNKKIDEKADSIDPEDMEMVKYMKQEARNGYSKDSFVRMQLEGERPTQYFCKKFQANAQFQ